MQSASGQDEEPGATTSNDPMTEDVQFQGEHEGEGESDTITLSSQASEGTEPEGEVSIWCDEKELQNERRNERRDDIHSVMP